ncbi:MAG: hypothetical protein IJQ34_02110 [Kiritimatiellae bacterium]|nr:hypothetical protein [Kiritimatiellia bacterium]
MIEPFKGELMLHPAALDYNSNQCSNNCAYCFAVTRNNARRGNPKALIDLVYGRSRREGLTRFLFDSRLPICISNRTDPLAAINIFDSRVAFAALNDAPNGLVVQTKGGSGKEIETLDLIKKKNVCCYITITSRNNSLLHRLEPGAAPYERRLEFASYAIKRGWAVIIGLNPLWAPWMSLVDLEKTILDCRERGAFDFLVQPLHISAFAADNMPQSNRERLTDSELDGADRHQADNPNCKEFIQSLALLSRLELEAGIRWMPTFFRPSASHMLDNTYRVLGKAMRSTQAFVDFAASSPKRLFGFSDFLAALSCGCDHLLDWGAPNLNGYLFCINRSAWRNDAKAKSAYSFRDVYSRIWNNRAFASSPQRIACGGRFVPVAFDDGKLFRDRLGNLILAKCDKYWKAWEKKTMTISDLKRKGVNTDELDQIQ